MRKITHLAVAVMATFVLGVGATSNAQGAPGDTRRPPPDKPMVGGQAAEDLEAAAKALGVDTNTALRSLDAQHALTVYADASRGYNGYVDFKINEDLTSGTLAIEPGTRSTFNNVPVGVAIQEVPLSKPEREAIAKELLNASGSRTQSPTSVSYDPFRNAFTVWAGTAADMDLIRSSNLQSAAPTLTAGSATVAVELATDQTSLFHGGMVANEQLTNAICTTGFGILLGGQGAYTSAGHCTWVNQGPTRQWCMEGGGCTGSVSNIRGYAFGGYVDRVAFVASGASWMVRIADSVEVDMDATAGHIYNGAFYCHYGVNGGGSRCGYIGAQNVWISGPNGGVYTSQSSARCQPGDSGGPVWQIYSNGRKPVGQIEGGDLGAGADSNGNYPCRYLALDDQLAGTGWTLL